MPEQKNVFPDVDDSTLETIDLLCAYIDRQTDMFMKLYAEDDVLADKDLIKDIYGTIVIHTHKLYNLVKKLVENNMKHIPLIHVYDFYNYHCRMIKKIFTTGME